MWMFPFRSWNFKERDDFVWFAVHIVYDVSIPIVNVSVYGSVFVAYIFVNVCNCNPFGIKSTINNHGKKKYNAISVCHLIIQSSHESCWFQRHQCEKKERSICSWRAKALWQISKIESRTAWLQKENIMKLLLIAFDYMWLQLKRKRNKKNTVDWMEN